MGAYLSEPIIQKLSSDELNEHLQVGASSMQGWRISQEDAHNCVLKFDENTSLFAVYDGHGGPEVATYCAEKLPEFLKKLKSYQDRDFKAALKEAFIKFDSTLLEENVIEILKSLAGVRGQTEDGLADEDDDEDLDELCEEGALPLDSVLAKYKAKALSAVANLPDIKKIKNEDINAAGSSSSSSSKPLSPSLRGRRNCDGYGPLNPSPSSSSSTSCTSSTETKDEGIIDDGTVSSSASASDNCFQKLQVDEEIKSNEAVSSNENGIAPSTDTIKSSNSPDSSFIMGTEKIQNGDSKILELSGVSSSSSSAYSSANLTETASFKSNTENGEISSPTSSGSKPVEGGGRVSARRIGSSTGISSSIEADDSSSDSDTDFQAYEVSDSDDDDDDDDDDDTRALDDVDDDEEGEDDSEDEDEDDDEGAEDVELDENALKDEQFCANMVEEPGKDSGCTAVVALLHGRDLYVANAGDSRCVVCRGGKAIDMSIDHKPEDEEELLRISKAGGRVTLDGRVNGGLNLSRAIGDHAYKMNTTVTPEEQMISALPDVKTLILHPEDEFMVLACDGIWNYMSSEEVVEFVKERIDDGFENMSKICEELFELCLAPNTLGDGTGCDNMTAVIVRFKPSILSLPTKLDPKECITAEEKVIISPPPAAAADATVAAADATAAAADADKHIGIIENLLDIPVPETKPDNVEISKSTKRAASPTPIDSSTSLNSDSSSTNNSATEDHCHKRLKIDDLVDSSDSAATKSLSSTIVATDEKVDCTSSSSNSCSSNGIAESEAATASILNTKDDIGSTTESPIET